MNTVRATIAGDSAESLLLLRQGQQLQNELRSGQLETFSEALLSIVAKVIYFCTRAKVKLRAWGVSIVLFFVLVIGTTGLALAWHVHMEAVNTWSFVGLVVLVHSWGALVAVLQLRSSRFFARLLAETIASAVIGNLRRIDDLRELSAWLRHTYRKKRQLIFCFAISVLLTSASIAGLYTVDQFTLINPGTIVLSLIGWFLGATGWYFFVPAVTLSSRLTRYDLCLFDPDPANSNLISSICSMMHAALFVATAIATIFTSGIFLLAGTNDLSTQIAFSVVCAWGPLVFTMLYYHYALFIVIRRTKIAALLPVQAAVLDLQHRVASLDSSQLDRLGKLLDLHKRILGSNSTALDWKGAVTTINTLLLPLASFLVARLGK
jgi:hypothetical protein